MVCRTWSDIASQDRFWQPIAETLFPLCLADADDDEEGDGTGGGVGFGATLGGVGVREAGKAGQSGPAAYRRMVKQYGRSLVERQITIAEWHEGIRLNFEIFDERDGKSNYSSPFNPSLTRDPDDVV